MRLLAASGADLIVYHPKAFGGPHFAEKLGIPAVMAVPLPMLVTTGEFPVIGFPRLPLGRGYNRFTYGVLERIMRMISGKHIKRWRREHGMPRAPRRWLETATGYWFLDAPGDWQPDAALAAFLAAGAPPVSTLVSAACPASGLRPGPNWCSRHWPAPECGASWPRVGVGWRRGRCRPPCTWSRRCRTTGCFRAWRR